MTDYIRWLRARTGPAPIQLNFAAAAVLDAGNVLLQRRADLDGWGFPGGAMELDESAAETAVREVREETGLTVRIDGLLGVYTKYRQEYPNGDVAQPVTVFFAASPVAGDLRGDAETLDVRWFPATATPELFSPQHRDALSDLLAGRHGVYR